MTGVASERARRLVRELSELPARDVEPLGTGTDSAAFRVDSDWVVRFPLTQEARRALRRELALLPELSQSLPVAVPRPECVAEVRGQLAFSAYRLLEGEPLSDAALAALVPPHRERALDELAALLDCIHRFPLQRARAAGVSFELYKGAYHDTQHRLLRELDGILSVDDLDAIARQRSAFECAQRECSSSPVLLHADIKPAHLLHNPASGALTGLLDWGDLSLGHADFDRAILGAFCGLRILEGLLQRLDSADSERARASLPFLLTVRWLQDLAIVSSGGDAKLAEYCRERLRRHLGESVA
jgi:aminoglycoside phosphotransferase (APT) family kinase protein